MSEKVTEGYIHTFDVITAKTQLQNLYEQVRRDFPNAAFVLCPLGTKLQSLAAFGFAFLNKPVAVTYVSSLSYFTEDYSQGVDEEYTELSLEKLLGVKN